MPHSSRRGKGKPLDAASRGSMEQIFGHSFANARVHANDDFARDGAGGAAAFSVGNRIGMASGAPTRGPVADALLAHELTHVMQSRGSEQRTVRTDRDSAAEHEADAMAIHAAVSLHGGVEAGPRPHVRTGRGLATRRCGAVPQLSADATKALAGKGKMTKAVAEEVLGIYAKMNNQQRQAFVVQYGRTPQMVDLTHRLAYADVAWGGRYVSTLRDLLQRVQRLGALDYASSHGLADQTAMVKAQAAEMDRRNFARAKKLQPPPKPKSKSKPKPPTVKEARKQHKHQVEETSIQEQTATMSKEKEAKLTKETNEAVLIFVAWAQKRHPELGITAANFRVAVREVFTRGKHVLAFQGTSGGRCSGGTPQAVVGEAFNTAVRVNPAYALPVVVHELYGHREYGKPEYGMTIYDAATKHMKTYDAPSSCGTGQRRQAELDAYGYQETEMYSWMRQLPYFTPTEKKDIGKTTHNFDPRFQIHFRIGTIKNQYEPRVAESLVRGLYMRFRLDPRIVPDALAAFEDGVRIHFPSRHKQILK